MFCRDARTKFTVAVGQNKQKTPLAESKLILWRKELFFFTWLGDAPLDSTPKKVIRQNYLTFAATCIWWILFIYDS